MKMESISLLPSIHPHHPHQARRSRLRLPIIITNNNNKNRRGGRRRSSSLRMIVRAIEVEGPTTSVDISWQIAVGSLAGITPFIIAGIEFGKRIMAQKKCEICRGSGLVLRDDSYIRCPNCGGFLPWQSWKRFFYWLRCSLSQALNYSVLMYMLDTFYMLGYCIHRKNSWLIINYHIERKGTVTTFAKFSEFDSFDAQHGSLLLWNL